MSSYPKILAIGHPLLSELLSGFVVVEEKIDGSQFSFGRDLDGNLFMRSRGATLLAEDPEKMFVKAIETVQSLDVRLGYTYRCEYLQKPKHNALWYGRVPNKHLIVFDIETAPAHYLNLQEKRREAERLGLEVVPWYFEGSGVLLDPANELNRESILGGPIEGIVIKAYGRYGLDGKLLVGKYVRADFKEINASEWRKANPTNKDIVRILIDRYKVPARWEKALAHLQEAGQLTNSPKDIGPLLAEIKKGLAAECEEDAKQILWEWAQGSVLRGATGGFPEWYKEKLRLHIEK